MGSIRASGRPIPVILSCPSLNVIVLDKPDSEGPGAVWRGARGRPSAVRPGDPIRRFIHSALIIPKYAIKDGTP